MKLLIFLILALTVISCSKVKQISKEAAVDYLDIPIGSASKYELIGITDERVYIEYKSYVFGVNTSIYWIPITDFSKFELYTLLLKKQRSKAVYFDSTVTFK